MKIKLYDMNNYPSNKAFFPADTFLTEMDIVPVALSIPTGEVRIGNISVDTMDRVTHFSFGMSDKTWIVEVNQKTVIGENLYIFTYEVDYLKTFFENASQTDELIVKRTTRTSNRREFLDDVPLSANLTYDDIQEYDFNLDTDIIVVMANSYISFDTNTGVTIFALGYEGHSAQNALGALWSALLTSDVISTAIGKSKGDTILSQIFGVYIVPKIPSNIPHEDGLLTYLTNDSLGQHTQATVDNCYGRYLFLDNGQSLEIQTIDTGITYNVNNWEDLPPVTHLYMYYPLIGTIDVPLRHLKDNNDTIKFKCIIDYISGTMTVYTVDMSKCVANVALPKIPLSTIEQSDITQILNNPYKSAIELVTMGKMEDTPVTLVEGGGYNALLYKKVYTQKVYHKILNKSVFNYVGNIVYSTMNIVTIKRLENHKYWCEETCLGFLKGAKWYVDGVKKALIEGFIY